MDTSKPLFAESFAAAVSHRNFYTRMASTLGCMRVALSRDTLTIRPHWYVSLLIRMLELDLFHEIPIADIQDVAERGRWWGYGKVDVCFRTADGHDRTVSLYLRRYREFVDTLRGVLSA
jgi:hypothetical protein